MLLIYLTEITPRTQFIFSLVLGELIGCDYRLTTSKEEYLSHEGPGLTYGSNPADSRPFIEESGLLSETGISAQEINLSKHDGYPVFFQAVSPDSLLPFDLFSASFYLVTRYEEYFRFIPDRFGRFRVQDSIAYKGGFLEVPVVHIWAQWLKKRILNHFPGLSFMQHTFTFLPTIDIDHAYAFRLKKFFRTLGGLGRAVLHGNMSQAFYRIRVLRGREKDPFDTYDDLINLHSMYGLSPVYFILFASYGGKDNNVTPDGRELQELLLMLDEKGTIGVHPSMASSLNTHLLETELFGLSNFLGRDITMSRQHFLKLSFPKTYRALIRMGITDDFSMGYPSQPGFRASVARPYKFFYLKKNDITRLTIHPVCVMDVTLRDHSHLSPDQALDKIKSIIDTVRSVNGKFIPIWHNESLSEYGKWRGWKRVYEEMIQYAVIHNNIS